jgi:hypothetical protein
LGTNKINLTEKIKLYSESQKCVVQAEDQYQISSIDNFNITNNNNEPPLSPRSNTMTIGLSYNCFVLKYALIDAILYAFLSS